MTDLDFDSIDKGCLVRGPEVRLTRAELDALRARALKQGVSQTSVVRAAVRSALDDEPDVRALECEAELTSRRKAGAAQTNRKR